LRVSSGLSFPKLTCTRSRLDKKRKQSARKKQAQGQVERAPMTTTGCPVDGNGLWRATRVHSAMTPQPPDLVKRFFSGVLAALATGLLSGGDKPVTDHGEGPAGERFRGRAGLDDGSPGIVRLRVARFRRLHAVDKGQ
jgi:hypothetical protein